MRNVLSLVVSVCVVACVAPDASDEDSQATASSAEISEDPGVVATQVTVGPSGKVTCFGFVGTFIVGTHVQHANWDNVGLPDECYGVAPNRTIWHAWPGHTWEVMPSGGLADNTLPAQLIGSTRRMVVFVAGPPASHWHIDFPTNVPGASWGRWSQCTSGQC